MREFIGVILIMYSVIIVAFSGTAMPNGAKLLTIMLFGLGLYLMTATEPRR